VHTILSLLALSHSAAKAEPVCGSASSEQIFGETAKQLQRVAAVAVSSAMLATKVQEVSAADSSNSLLEHGVLQNMLGYVGPGHHLFVTLVSRRWRDIYASFTNQRRIVADKKGLRSSITCVSKMTLFSSVFTAPSRVRLAHSCGLDCSSAGSQRAAGMHADVATLAAAHDVGMKFSTAAIAAAAQRKKLTEVQYLHHQGCPWPSSGLLELAASSGHFELVRWCCKHGCPWQNAARAPYYAALSGNVALMAWVLKRPGVRSSEHDMYTAALHGHTALCHYLHSQQCPWDSQATNVAAVRGHVDLLRWLVDNGCPWYADELCVKAAQGGSIDVMTHLQQQGLLTGTAVLSKMLDKAASVNKLAAAKWLREQGAEWPTVFAWSPWSGAALQWAKAEGCIIPITD
jgi:hypothetical protein